MVNTYSYECGKGLALIFTEVPGEYAVYKVSIRKTTVNGGRVKIDAIEDITMDLSKLTYIDDNLCRKDQGDFLALHFISTMFRNTLVIQQNVHASFSAMYIEHNLNISSEDVRISINYNPQSFDVIITIMEDIYANKGYYFLYGKDDIEFKYIDRTINLIKLTVHGQACSHGIYGIVRQTQARNILLGIAHISNDDRPRCEAMFHETMQDYIKRGSRRHPITRYSYAIESNSFQLMLSKRQAQLLSRPLST